jgi:hypothetical protein
MVELYLRSPICLYGVVLNSLGTGTTLPFYYNCYYYYYYYRHHGPLCLNLERFHRLKVCDSGPLIIKLCSAYSFVLPYLKLYDVSEASPLACHLSVSTVGTS